MTYIDRIARAVRDAVSEGVAVPDDSDDLFRIYAVLLLARGTDVTREDVHNAWTAWMANRGERHDAMVPFGELAPDVQDQDLPYVAAIRAAARDVRWRSGVE